MNWIKSIFKNSKNNTQSKVIFKQKRTYIIYQTLQQLSTETIKLIEDYDYTIEGKINTTLYKHNTPIKFLDTINDTIISVSIEDSWLSTETPYGTVIKIWNLNTQKIIRTIKYRKKFISGHILKYGEHAGKMIIIHNRGMDLWDIKNNMFNPIPAAGDYNGILAELDNGLLLAKNGWYEENDILITDPMHQQYTVIHRTKYEQATLTSIGVLPHGKFILTYKNKLLFYNSNISFNKPYKEHISIYDRVFPYLLLVLPNNKLLYGGDIIDDKTSKFLSLLNLDNFELEKSDIFTSDSKMINLTLFCNKVLITFEIGKASFFDLDMWEFQKNIFPFYNNNIFGLKYKFYNSNSYHPITVLKDKTLLIIRDDDQIDIYDYISCTLLQKMNFYKYGIYTAHSSREYYHDILHKVLNDGRIVITGSDGSLFLIN